MGRAKQFKSKYLALFCFVLIGISYSQCQIVDTLYFVNKNDTTIVVHKNLVDYSIFPTWELTLKPASILAINSSFIGGNTEFKYRLNKVLLSANYTGMYSQKLILHSIQNFETPMYSAGVQVGFRAYGTAVKSTNDVKVFVKEKDRKKKISIPRNIIKRYSFSPIIGVNWMRFQPMFFGENSIGDLFVSGDAKIVNLTFGLHLDVSKGYQTKANSKTVTKIKRSSVDIGLMYAAITNYSWYQRSLYDSPFTYSPVSSDLFPSVTTNRIGGYWKYNYTIGLSNNGGLTLGAMFGLLPRQTSRITTDFMVNEELSMDGVTLGLSIGYTFAEKIF